MSEQTPPDCGNDTVGAAVDNAGTDTVPDRPINSGDDGQISRPEESVPAPGGDQPGQGALPLSGNVPPPRKKRTIVKRIVLLVLLVLAVYAVYTVVRVYVTPDRNIQQIYLVPKDAAIILESREPVGDWHRLSGSEPWKTLSRSKLFGEIAASAAMLDSMIHENRTLLSLVGRRDMIISLHKTKTREWDFLILVDLQKVSKIDVFKDQMENILKLTGGTVTQRTYNGTPIIEMRDAATRDILYMAFVDNHFAASFTSRLVEAAIDERERPHIGLDDAFLQADRLVGGKGLYRVYVNYGYLPQFLSIYFDSGQEYIEAFSGSMEFAGMYFNVDRSVMELKGYTLMNEEPDPYVSALLASGSQKMKAHEIMSGRTAMYGNLGFGNPVTFVRDLESALRQRDRALYDSYADTRRRLEEYFDISLTDNFLGWMSGEIAFSQSEAGLLGREPELILAVRARNIKDARRNMEYLETRIRKRSPVKIKAVQYKGYPVNYVELKGFFRLFFGRLFDSFETPYYTYVDDYVVFSNRSSSLLSFIEDFEQKSVLGRSEGFKKAQARAGANSTMFAYVDMVKFFPQMQALLSPEAWAEISTDRDVLCDFPYLLFQVAAAGSQPSIQMTLLHQPGSQAVAEAAEALADAPDEQMIEDEGAATEKELMNELQRFYVEKFQGNVLREFYDGGALKSESEVRGGKRHGRYREYYESGSLRLRGKYSNNRPKGAWKYYTEDGKFERKERY